MNNGYQIKRLSTVLFLFSYFTLSAQTEINVQQNEFPVSAEEVRKHFDPLPCFGIYKNSYIITGVPLNDAITKHTADVKFQVSVYQKLTKTVLPFNAYLMLVYNQKSFWNIYATSSPFRDNNYNPGILLVKPFFGNNRIKGSGSLSLEHESNGKPDGNENRSFNYFALSGTYVYNARFLVHAKIWAGWLSKENSDLYKYRGYGFVSLDYRTVDDRFLVSATVNPRNRFGSFNIQLEAGLRLVPTMNQYLFVQWCDRYGDILLDYKQYSSMLRVGICFK
jgi:phospholipase A1